MAASISSRLSGRVRAAVPALLMAAAVGFQASPAAAQAQTEGFKTDSQAPIEVISDTAEWIRAENRAIFTGAVDAVQGEMRLRADKVYVFYEPPEPAEEGGKNDETASTPQKIKLIDARGHVIITDDTGQTAEGDWAKYPLAERKIYMGDTVVLNQGENVVRGQHLIFNLETGAAVVEAGTAGAEGSQGGRVRSFFAPEQPPAEEEPAETPQKPAESPAPTDGTANSAP